MKKITLLFFSIVLTASAANAQLLQKKSRGELQNRSLKVEAKTPSSDRGAKLSPVRTLNQGFVGSAMSISMPTLNGRPELRPVKEEVQIPEIYGSVLYSNSWTEGQASYGLYKIPGTSDGEFQLKIAGPKATYGGVLKDGIYYTMYTETIMGMFTLRYCSGYDINTGEVVYTKTPASSNLAVGLAVNPMDDEIYGLFNGSNGMRLGTIEFGNSIVVNDIAVLPGNWNSFTIDKDGVGYAINEAGVLYTVDLTTGDFTRIGSTGITPKFVSGACIDPTTGRMFWSVSPADERGYLYEVNTTTGVATLIADYVNCEEIAGLYVRVPEAEPKAPAKVTNLSANFPDGKLTGSLTFTVPSTLYDGTPAEGSVKYKVTANGDLVDLASVQYGETVTIEPVTVYETGIVNFVVVLTNEAGDSPKAKTKCFVGNGVPEAPKNVHAEYANGTMTITWDPVTKSADGGYVNPDDVTYGIVGKFNDTEVTVGEGIKGMSLTQALNTPGKLTTYTYKVTAVFDNAISVEGISNTVVLGNIIPPYTNALDTPEDGIYWTAIDANEDGTTWKWSTYENGWSVEWSSSEVMDDWLMSMPVKLEANKAYRVSIDAKNLGSFQEKIEVCYGSAATAEGMTNTLVPVTLLTTGEYTTLSGWIISDKDQTVYVGIHGVSDPDQYYLMVANFAIEEGVSSKRPAAVENLDVVGGTKVLNATVSFIAPSVNIGGDAIESLTKIEVSLNGELVKTFEAPAVGTPLAFTDENLIPGIASYEVVAYNEDGAGLPSCASAQVGFTAPDFSPATANIIQEETATLGTVLVSWDAVAETVTGQTLTTDDVTYTLASITDDGYVGDILKEGIGITAAEVVYQAPTAPQSFAQFAIKAATNGGSSSWYRTGFLPVGPAYTDYDQTFAGGTPGEYIVAFMSLVDQDNEWNPNQVYIFPDNRFSDVSSVTGDDGFLALMTPVAENSMAVYSGKISCEGLAQPALTFYNFNFASDDLNTVEVSVRELGKPWKVLLPATASSEFGPIGWNKVTVPLEGLTGKDIQYQITVVAKNYVYNIFDDFKVADMLDYDLVAQEISAPSKVIPGQTFNVTVNVANDGCKDAENFTVELYKNGEVAATRKVEKLEAFKSAAYTFEQEMGLVAVDPVSYKAVVVFEADENGENNETEAVVTTPVVAALPAVKNLVGEAAENGNILRWDEPELEIAAGGNGSDFEDGESWAKEYDGWTFIDEDGAAVGGFQNTDVPGIIPGETTASFFVFDASADGFNQSFQAHSGSKYLASLFRDDDGRVSDWAISPTLDGTDQTISFWARSYSPQYPEAFEICYSTTGVELEDFTVLEGSMVAAVPAEWTEYRFELPEGAKYFAIHSVATGSFMFMVDDVTFSGAKGEELSLIGYKVYRDGELIADNVEECAYLDVESTVGEHEYAVVPVFDRGEGKPAFVTVTTKTGIADVNAGIVITTADKSVVVLGAEGVEVTVSALDGKVIFAAEGAAKTVVPVSTGVYVVKAGEKVAKVIVR